MKQHITEKQFLELNPKSKQKWWRGETKKEFPEDLPNIGQMIEFLGEDWYKTLLIAHQEPYGEASIECFYNLDELCDSLWEAVRGKLNGNN